MDDLIQTAIKRRVTKAEHDLKTGELAISADPPITDTASFHAQQCAEKCLKAFLVSAGSHVERTHDLPRLVALCSQNDPEFDRLRDAAMFLTDYAVATRYPDEMRDVPVEEASEALAKAAEVMTFVRARLDLDSRSAPTHENG